VIKKKREGEMNVSPEISPDGSKIIFFSERDLFSIDLYVADAKTGEVLRKVTDTSTSAHTESLQFISSAGSWDHTSKKFVFPGIARGHSVLTIVDVEHAKKEREISVPSVDEVTNPTWSPDGATIAFSGLSGGFTDLFLYDLKTDQLKRLTNDQFAEMDPAWSPDGKTLAFSTDRFTTNLQTLVAGDLRLAVLDVASGEVKPAGGFEGAKNISPQWTADGRGLYFVSDRGGISNIYRSESGGATTQLTNFLTGASGITELSPALSVGEGRLVFSAYEDNGYTVYALESPQQLAGGELQTLPTNAAVLPPRRAGAGPVYTAINNETAGLPTENAAAAPAEDYKPKLGLDFAGQPTIAVGRDPFGTYVGGGISLAFSDMLGNHVVYAGAQATNRFDEFGGNITYINRTHRWNWGTAIDQTPYVYRSFNAGLANVQGIPAYVEQEYRFLQTDRSATGLLSYPFSRAHRIDVNGGFRQVAYKQDVTTRVFDYNSGQQVSEDRENVSTADNLNLGEASAALVFDTSISGVASPIRGSRYRFEVAQTSGTISYTGLTADARTYQMPFRPVTFAFRGLFFGRYGSGAEDYRLPTLYLGYPGLVRGYDSYSFQSDECQSSDGSCPVFDRLLGSRVAIVNAEMRVPLWALFGGSNFYGPLPVELALFADSGVAWGQTNSQQFAQGPNKDPVSSAGVAVRANLFGFAIAELDYVRPLDRPQRGWLWQFNLMPGF
jgi:Tol biopolymer transport system component